MVFIHEFLCPRSTDFSCLGFLLVLWGGTRQAARQVTGWPHRGIELHHGPVQPRQRQAAVPRADELRPPVNILRVLMMIAEAAAAPASLPGYPY